MQSTEDRMAMLKLAQIYRCSTIYDSYEITDRLCDKEGHNNYQLPNNVVIPSDYFGNTVLHIVAYHRLIGSSNVDILLNNNADFTIKNQDGLTALHFVTRRSIHPEKELVTKLLTAHITFNNVSNPCDNNGISHFHIACMFDNVEVIEFFLKHGISVNHAVNVDSYSYAGYTPLHFAASHYCLRTTDILLEHGANIFAKDAKGMTPLQILIEQKMHIYNIINGYKEDGENPIEPTDALLEKIQDNEIITKLLLIQGNNLSEASFFKNVGISRLQIFCTMKDSSLVESFLKHNPDIHLPVPANSPTWPGYTALHFAANFNIETVKILMMKGANLEFKDANGVTPFDICLSKQDIEEIIIVMSHKLEWKHIHFLRSNVQLLNLLFAMENSNDFKNFLENIDINMTISRHAPLWPGYTPLHVAVLFSERFSHECRQVYCVGRVKSPSCYHLVTECLRRGADITIQDSNGSTPLHLAFKLEKTEIVEILLRSCHNDIDLVDEDGLSYLLMACAFDKKEVVKRLVNKKNVNMVYRGKTIFKYYRFQYLNYDNTPLHIAIQHKNVKVVKILLKNGADVNKVNARGRTPIHLAAFYKSRYIGLELLKSSSDLKNHTVPGYNLNYLHVACTLKSLHVARELIKLGIDVNEAIIFDKNHDHFVKDDNLGFFVEHNGWTPLHFAVEVNDISIVKLLIESGADIFAKGHDCVTRRKLDCVTTIKITPLSIALKSKRLIEIAELFFKIIENDDSLKKRMRRDFGITLLHIACYMVNVEVVQSLLKRRANVNAQVHNDSAVWAGFTPLHVLIRRTAVWSGDLELENNADEIVKLLLCKGADVTLATSCGNTPIHFSFAPFKIDDDDDDDPSDYISYESQINLPEHSRVKMLMKAHKNFKVNPINSEGISHFHIAVVIDDLDAAQKFLKHNVDVNQMTNYFNKCAAGYSPLHYAIDVLSHKTSPKYPMVVLLLTHGADANVEDVYGNTPLHLAFQAKAPRTKLVDMLVNHGADITKKNLCSHTPLEIAD